MTKQELNKKVEQAGRQQSGRSRRSRILSVLASIVVFCVTYALILPALTWERGLICELKEHTHTDSCYTLQTVPAGTELICERQEHTHADTCYTEQTVLVCEQQETQGHTHTEACYDADGNLICEQIESAGHTHTDSCYTTQQVLTCTQEEHTRWACAMQTTLTASPPQR